MTFFEMLDCRIRGSIVVRIPACHAGDRGSIPRRGGSAMIFSFWNFEIGA